jgi:2-polyprenyl-3-methyl-5-hydroxy-6-metoxy-1,4-benzoquinol methylase
MENLIECPVCASTIFQQYLEVVDHTVTQQAFKIQQCKKCDFLFTNPRPTEQEIGKYYQSQDYISHHDEAKDIMSRVYNSVRNYTLKEKLKLINSLVPGKGNLLDIGCGTGSFLQTCRQDHWKTVGTEPDEEARKIATNRTQGEIFESINQVKSAAKSFQIITMWHVLEHVHQLNETMDWLQKQLDNQGKIIIAVPNPQSEDAAKYGAFWAAYDVPRHLYHFTKGSMQTLLDKHHLKIDSIKPMWFDSYYVSMLSTKYQYGKTKLLNSFITGSQSNLKGKSDTNNPYNTSSLIYIISKK